MEGGIKLARDLQRVARVWYGARRTLTTRTGRGWEGGGIAGVGRGMLGKIGKDVDGLGRVCSIEGVKESGAERGPREKSKDALTPRRYGDKR